MNNIQISPCFVKKPTSSHYREEETYKEEINLM